MSLSPGKLKHMNALSNKAGVIAAAAMDQRGSLKKVHRVGQRRSRRTGHGSDDGGVQDRGVARSDASRQRDSARSGIGTSRRESAREECRAAARLRGNRVRQHAAGPPARSAAASLREAHQGNGRGCGQDSDLLHAVRSPADVNDIKHAFIERIGAECEAYDIPFFLEFVGYDEKGGDEKGLEYAKKKPGRREGSMEEFSKPQYKVDVLKVEVPINPAFVEGSRAFKGQAAYTRAEALDLFRECASVATSRSFI